MLGRELTSLTSVSSEVLPTPEQLSSSCSRSSCLRSGASGRGTQTDVSHRLLRETVPKQRKASGTPRLQGTPSPQPARLCGVREETLTHPPWASPSFFLAAAPEQLLVSRFQRRQSTPRLGLSAGHG